MPKLWSYLRWSSARQEWTDSERRQDDAITAYSIRRNIRIINGYRDEETSAWTGDNSKTGDLRRFIDDIGKGEDYPMPGDELGIESTDRLSRMERIDSIPLVREIIDKGISIALVTMDLIINRAELKAKPWLFDLLSNELNRGAQKSNRRSEMVGKAKAEARARGRANGTPINWGNCPGWLMLVDIVRAGGKIIAGRYVEHPANAPILRQIYAWAAAGRGGAWIAHQLNDANIPVFRKIGPKMEKRIAAGNAPKWHPNVIRQLLKDRRVLGYLQPCIRVNRKRVPDGGSECRIYPKTIDDTLFVQVQALRGKGLPPGRTDRGVINLVKGLCRCSVCRKGVVIRHQRNRPFLVCEMARHGDCSNRRYFPYDGFEEILLQLFRYKMGELLRGLFPASEHRSRVAELETRIGTLRAERRRLIQRFGKGDADADDLIDGLARQIEGVEKELRVARQDDLSAQYYDDPRSETRIREALDRLHTHDLDERDNVRALLATELARRINSVVLQPDRSIVVAINDGRQRTTTIEAVVQAARRKPGKEPDCKLVRLRAVSGTNRQRILDLLHHFGSMSHGQLVEALAKSPPEAPRN